MKYSEFKKLVEKRGLKPIDVGEYVDVKDEHDYRLLRVSKNYKFLVDTGYIRFSVLSGYDKESLFNLAVELASTPLDEREDEKRYRLKLPFAMESGGYLNTYGDKLFVSSKANVVDYKNIFTESKIAELKAKHNLDSFVLEEVLEDE